MKKEIIALLQESDDYVSGEEMSQTLGISRAAIWKHIHALKEEGYEILSVSKKGYRLMQLGDRLSENELSPYMPSSGIGAALQYYESVDSTSSIAKKLADEGAKEGLVVISEEQTGGRGRMGRNWISPKYKGIWMSIILKPLMEPQFVAKITQVAAAAVVLAAKDIGFDVGVKWPNDLVLNGKKVCGILTEMSGEMNQINYIVIGVGINANLDTKDFDDSTKKTATSFKIEGKQKINRQKLAGRIFHHMNMLYEQFLNDGLGARSIQVCREHSVLIGKKVVVMRGSDQYEGQVLSINDQGELVVKRDNGEIEALFSGEVSIRGEKGYVPT